MWNKILHTCRLITFKSVSQRLFPLQYWNITGFKLILERTSLKENLIINCEYQPVLDYELLMPLLSWVELITGVPLNWGAASACTSH